ncbi:peptidylprolyl isomerase [Parasphingorhabdus halotolerans]|uniref:Peptidylprolyl isomerase n=1 Tax=Parasphingorhabdus halotolerans TaxID=2725558 RepID=A0A6H2DN95_9SPHN|nr:peptidylprolyl isomerase [Parasphingorhabdus halotolerans]QJB69607.1 peptidylprolyl isomerase [Parasphingorhabdus halotolerans]
MQKLTIVASLATLLSTIPAIAQEAEKPEFPSPNEIVDKAAPEQWRAIAASDLLVMQLVPDAAGKDRRVVIQLMPEPFSQGWIRNIRKLAAANWWDGTSINRVQDNYVVQWGDASEEKALPEGLETVPESEYTSTYNAGLFDFVWRYDGRQKAEFTEIPRPSLVSEANKAPPPNFGDIFDAVGFIGSMPIAMTYSRQVEYRVGRVNKPNQIWPVHCYGMVGVGRNLSPDTGSGAELYTVIGHAPRHLDRNIAVVGRIIEGIEHLSSLPRGTGPLGFYETADERVPIQSIRLVSDLPTADQPRFEYLSTEGETFAQYADARANRRDPFFIMPAGGADICNIPVPVRRVKGE